MLGYSAGGSDQSLYNHLMNLDKSKFFPIAIYKENSDLIEKLKAGEIKTIRQNFFATDSTAINKTIIFPGSRTVIYNIRVFFEVFLLINTIIRSKVSIVHLNNSIRNNRAAAIAGIITLRKVIVHDRMGFKLDIIDKILLRFVHQIIAISEQVKKTYENKPYIISKLTLIHNGVDINQFSPVKNKKENEFLVGSVGRLVNWKGVHVLLNAVPLVLLKFPDCKFLIIGEGREKDNLKKLANNLKVEKAVRFMGKADNVAELYNSMDIFVHTAIVPEPFGRVIIEAMASGLPVISTKIGGPTEIITDSNNGFLVAPNNAKILAEKIIFLLNNKSIREKMIKNGIDTVLKQFDIKLTTRKIEELYN